MKLLVFDVEGTIFAAPYRIDGMDYASTMWQPLAHSLGEAGICRERELHDRWEYGSFSNYLEWVEATCVMHKELGLTKQAFEHQLSCAEYTPGVVDFFDKLNRNQFIPVIISGGFQELVRRAQSELKIPHGHGACEYFFNREDGLLNSYSLVPCDFDGKYKYVKVLLERYKLDADLDWAFVGDGKNDCAIAEKAPISFAFNGHPQLKRVATFCIDDRDGAAASFNEIGQILNWLTEADYRDGKERKIIRASAKAITIKKEKRNTNKTAKKGELGVTILEEDYQKRPEMHLSELLDEYRVAFVGLRVHYNTYRQLEELCEKAEDFKMEERNKQTGKLKMIEANFEHKNNADYKALKRRDFIFIDIDCISHSQSWRVEELGVPFAKIKRQPGRLNDAEPLIRAMSNVLYRHFLNDIKV